MERNKHLRVVEETRSFEDQMRLFRFICRDEESSDALVWHVFKETKISSEEELSTVFAVLSEERPEMYEKLNQVFAETPDATE